MADAVSHDQNFKNLIVDYPREALAFFTPEEAPLPDDEASIVPVRQEQLKERLGDRFRELDAPLRVEWADGRAPTVFALEAESDARRFSLRRLARYCLDLADMFDTDRVVPVVVFLRAADRAPASLSLVSARRLYLGFDYVSCKLADLPAERWMDSDNVVARVNLPNMRYPAERRVDVYAAAMRGLLELEADPGRRAKYVDFIDIYAGLTDNERARYRERYPEESNVMQGVVQRARDEGIEQGRIEMRGVVQQARDEGIEQGRIEMKGVVQQARDEGIEQGRVEGIREGRVEGERTVLERQLRRRFGPLSPAAAERLREASAADLEAWAERLLDARTPDDVFAPSP